MNILKKSREDLSNKDLYFLLTDKSIKKMQEIAEKTINVVDYVLYEDVRRDTGEISKVLAIKTDNGTYATNSASFIECFEKIVECFGDDFKTISIMQGTSNRGRKYLQCSYVA